MPTPAGCRLRESGVPSALPTTSARVYVDKSSGHDTGVAIANPGGAASNVVLRAFQNNGSTAAGNGPATLNLLANSQRAGFAGEFIDGLPGGFTGVLEITSSTPFVALTLRSLINTRGDFLLTTFPIADAMRPAPAPLVFPQIADGGGYTTQFIFVNAAGSSTVGLSLLGDVAPLSFDGNP